MNSTPISNVLHLSIERKILRYVTRYQSANKLYLSINLETLIASLLEKKQEKQIGERF